MLKFDGYRTKHFEDAVQDSTAALELEPEYVKALLRRAAAYEELDDLEHALADSTKVRKWCLPCCKTVSTMCEIICLTDCAKALCCV